MEKCDANVRKTSAVGSQWSDQTCNQDTVKSTEHRVTWILYTILDTIYSPIDINRPDTVGTSSSHGTKTFTWIHLCISVTSVHNACVNTHIPALQAKHQAYWSDQSDTHTVLAFMPPTTRLVSPLLLSLSSPLPIRLLFLSQSQFFFPTRLNWLPTFLTLGALLSPHAFVSLQLTLQLNVS